jgi:RimJ/RimL family protein N-acetyltransferase
MSKANNIQQNKPKQQEEAHKNILDELPKTMAKSELKQTIWDFSNEKNSCLFAQDQAVFIRPITSDNADFYIGIRAQYSMMYRGPIREKSHSNVQLLLDDLCQPESFFCIIERSTEQVPIGYIGIKDTSTDLWEIAVELDGKYTHQGYGAHSIRLFLNEVQRITGKNAFRAVIASDNIASQKCVEKLGAQLVGMCNGPVLKLPVEKERFEEQNLDLIDTHMIELAERLGTEPRKLLSHVLDYRLTCPL